MSKNSYIEVDYKCAKEGCGNKQTIRYFPDDAILPVTCCVSCRAGFGKEVGDMMSYRLGMFPTRKVSVAA